METKRTLAEIKANTARLRAAAEALRTYTAEVREIRKELAQLTEGN